MPSRDRDDAAPGPTRALTALLRQSRGQLATRQQVEGGQYLIARWTWSRRAARTRAPLRIALGIGVAAAVLGILGVGLPRWSREPSLALAVDGGRVLPAGQIEADPQSSPKLRFSDGSEVALLAGSKGTLRSVDAHGARVSLAAGGAHVDVAHVPGAHWLFDAGPFLVTVTGTAFTIGWDPVDERLDVEMDRGSVEVRGPLSDGPIPVRAGQHLVVRVREHETWVRDRDEEATAPEGPRAIEPASNVPPSPPAGAEAVAAASASHATRALGERNWSVQLARGNFDDVLRDAERAGIATCLAQASSDDLSALADAARYSRHDDVARRALVALRRRFPRSPAARDASFLLGRLEEAEQNHAKGIEWYDRYLVESPNGTYAPEALGRKMNLTQSLFGDTPAREVASEYLSRFPQGMYAARARTLSQSP